MKQFGIFAVSAVLATAINGLFVPRQDGGSLSDFHGHWYNVGITSNAKSMLERLSEKHGGIQCSCPRTNIEGSDGHSDRAELTSTCDLRKGSETYGELSASGYIEYEGMHSDQYTVSFRLGDISFTSSDHPDYEMPFGMPDDEDMDIHGQVLSTHGDGKHDAIVFWCSAHGETYGSLYYTESSVDDDTFHRLVGQIEDSMAKDSMVRFGGGCD